MTSNKKKPPEKKQSSGLGFLRLFVVWFILFLINQLRTVLKTSQIMINASHWLLKNFDHSESIEECWQSRKWFSEKYSQTSEFLTGNASWLPYLWPLILTISLAMYTLAFNTNQKVLSYLVFHFVWWVKFLKTFEFGAQRGEGYRGESALLCSQF